MSHTKEKPLEMAEVVSEVITTMQKAVLLPLFFLVPAFFLDAFEVGVPVDWRAMAGLTLLLVLNALLYLRRARRRLWEAVEKCGDRPKSHILS